VVSWWHGQNYTRKDVVKFWVDRRSFRT
jgi:hypothetical protein